MRCGELRAPRAVAVEIRRRRLEGVKDREEDKGRAEEESYFSGSQDEYSKGLDCPNSLSGGGSQPTPQAEAVLCCLCATTTTGRSERSNSSLDKVSAFATSRRSQLLVC